MKKIVFPSNTFFIVVNVFVWLAESYLDVTEREIQPLYGYPVVIASIYLPLETIALLGVPLTVAATLFFTTDISKQNFILLVLYSLSTAPFTLIAFPVLALTTAAYLYSMEEITGLEENIATAPAGLTAVILTYSIGILI